MFYQLCIHAYKSIHTYINMHTHIHIYILNYLFSYWRPKDGYWGKVWLKLCFEGSLKLAFPHEHFVYKIFAGWKGKHDFWTGIDTYFIPNHWCSNAIDTRWLFNICRRVKCFWWVSAAYEVIPLPGDLEMKSVRIFVFSFFFYFYSFCKAFLHCSGKPDTTNWTLREYHCFQWRLE